MSRHEGELEYELESELDSELESEFESELEGEGESEQFLGTIARGIGSLLGESESELESELESEFEGEALFENEFESEFESEQFLGGLKKRLFRGIGGFISKAAPILKQVAKVAVPMVAKAVGGPFGGILSSAAGSLLSEHELEAEYEGEFENMNLEFESHEHESHEHESHEQESHEQLFEHEHEHEHELEHELMAEHMAAMAGGSQSEYEAEAMVGAATVTVLNARDRAALRRVLPHMIRGTAILTRILRRRRITRPVVRAVPTIVRRSTRILAQRARQGRPITRRTAGRVMAIQTGKVLTNPRLCAAAIARNAKAVRRAVRPVGRNRIARR